MNSNIIIETKDNKHKHIKEKTYKFDNIGYVKMLWDEKQEKIGKINCMTSVVLIVSMLGLGILSKELGLIMIANIGIGKITSWIVG